MVNKESRRLYLISHDNAAELEKLLEEAIGIIENAPEKETIFLATAKYELAWFYENYKPKRTEPTGLEKRLEALKRIQDLYLHSLQIQEKFTDKSDDKILKIYFNLAESYSKSGHIEKALSFYEKFIAGTEAKYGKSSNYLVTALQKSAIIKNMFGQKAEVDEIIKRVKEITAKEETFANLLLNLTPRAKSFNYKGVSEKGKSLKISKIDTLPRAAGYGAYNNGNAKYNSSNSSILADREVIYSANRIVVKITIDEQGNVIEAHADLDNQKKKAEIEKTVFDWKFEPFVYQEKASKIKGIVYYYF